MNISRNDIKRTRVIKARRRLVVVLAAIFLMIFLIGKLTAAPEEDVVAKENIIESTEQPASPKKSGGKPGDKVVYLTFDDGPTTLTEQFLDVLKEQGMQATFFMQGTNLQKTELQESVKRATEEGHYVGAHSISHDYQKLYKNGRFVSEMKETLSLIKDITGTNPKLVRPPYGSAPGLESEQVRSPSRNHCIL